jgi:hypothetical protein
MKEKYGDDRVGPDIIDLEWMGRGLTAFKREYALRGADYEVRSWTEQAVDDNDRSCIMRIYEIKNRFVFQNNIYVEILKSDSNTAVHHGLLWKTSGDFYYWKYDEVKDRLKSMTWSWRTGL